MPQLYAAADLLVTRGGASTIAELRPPGTPAILVPWPGAAENHQVDNARWLADEGAAVLRRAAPTLTADRLIAEIDGARAPIGAAGACIARGGARREAGAVPPQRRLIERRRASVAAAADDAPPAAPRSTCRSRAGYHVVGVGGPGMSAIAIVLAEMGHDVTGSDIRERPCSTGCAPPGSTVHVGHDRGARARPRRRSPASHGHPGAQHRARRGPTSRACPSLRRAGHARRRSAPRRSRSAVAGTHGKTTTTSMLMLILAEAGLRPSFVIGGDVTDMGTGAQWTGGEWFVVEADESDGTHLELPLHGTILTNVEVDHLDHYGTFEAIVDGFDRYLAQVPGPKVLCVDDPRVPPLAASRTARSPTAPSPTPTYVAVDVDAERRRVHVRRRAPRRARSATCRLPLRGVHNVRNATGALAMAVEHRRAVRRGRGARSPSSAAWPAASTSAASTAAPRSSTTTPTCPPRSPPCSLRRTRQRRRLAAGGRRVPAQPLQPHGRACGPSTATRSSTPTWWCSPTSTPSGTTPIPGVTGKLRGERRARRPPDTPRGVAAPARRPGRVPRPRARATATCASRWGAATSPRCPTRCRRRARASCASIDGSGRREPRATPQQLALARLRGVRHRRRAARAA